MDQLNRYVAFDLEFNTVDSYSHLLQVSAVRFENHQEIEFFDSYVFSEIPIKSFISGLTGITSKKIKHAPPASEVLERFKEFIGNDLLIGYSALKNDIPILQAYGLDLEDQYGLDVYEEASRLKNTYLRDSKGMSLQHVAQHLGIQGRGHDSLADARMTAQVYEALLDLETNEQYLTQQEVMTNNPFAGLNDLFSSEH